MVEAVERDLDGEQQLDAIPAEQLIAPEKRDHLVAKEELVGLELLNRLPGRLRQLAQELSVMEEASTRIPVSGLPEKWKSKRGGGEGAALPRDPLLREGDGGWGRIAAY